MMHHDKQTYHLDWMELHAVSHCNLSCKSCITSSPYFKKTQHEPEDYFPWFDLMLERKITLETIGIIGGEPFLHKDLPTFVSKFKERYDLDYVLTTNAFWISEKNIEKYSEMLSKVSLVVVSLYPPVVEQVGGLDAMYALLDKVRAYTKVKVRPKKEEGKPVIDSFAFMKFTKKPVKQIYCDLDSCINLLSTGVLTRCAPAGYSDKNPFVTDEFWENRGNLVFDLKGNWIPRNLAKWRGNMWPLDGCKYCTLAANYYHPWVSDPSIRKLPVINQ